MHRDETTGHWRMLYTSRWKPYTLFVPESDGDLHFRPLPCDDIRTDHRELAASQNSREKILRSQAIANGTDDPAGPIGQVPSDPVMDFEFTTDEASAMELD